MEKIKFLRRLLALLAVAVVTMSVFTGQDLDVTLTNLRRELYHDYKRIDKTRQQLNSRYEEQHQKMVGIVKKCNDMSLMIYSQKQDYTFDISYALERVTQEFNDFSKNRTPYEQIVANLDIEINREVLVPVIVLCSIPSCAYWALDIFEFKDLYLTIFEKPFFTQGEFRVSVYNLLFLAGMFVVKQYVLVPERIGYIDRAREVIYKALNENGITIPFPQCDIHMINDDN